jgi:hypothetical protein
MMACSVNRHEGMLGIVNINWHGGMRSIENINGMAAWWHARHSKYKLHGGMAACAA